MAMIMTTVCTNQAKPRWEFGAGQSTAEQMHGGKILVQSLGYISRSIARLLPDYVPRGLGTSGRWDLRPLLEARQVPCFRQALGQQVQRPQL